MMLCCVFVGMRAPHAGCHVSDALSMSCFDAIRLWQPVIKVKYDVQYCLWLRQPRGTSHPTASPLCLPLVLYFRRRDPQTAPSCQAAFSQRDNYCFQASALRIMRLLESPLWPLLSVGFSLGTDCFNRASKPRFASIWMAIWGHGARRTTLMLVFCR